MTLFLKNFWKQIIKNSKKASNFINFTNLYADLIKVALLCIKAYAQYAINMKAAKRILYSWNVSLQKWSLRKLLAHKNHKNLLDEKYIDTYLHCEMFGQ